MNTRPEGRQRIASDRAVAAMPHGGAFVAFASAVLADPADQGRFEVRGTLLGVDGAPQPTAGAQSELTYEPAGGVPGDFAYRTQPSVVAPDREDGSGAIVFGLSDERSSRVVAQLIRGSGARLGSGEDFQTARLEVSLDEGPTCEALRGRLATPSACVTDPVAVALEPTRAPPESTRDFVVFWNRILWDGGAPISSIRARRIRARFDASELLPPDELVVSPPGSIVLAITAVALSGDRTLLLWQEQEASSTVLTHAQPFDNDTLVPQGDPWTLGRSNDGAPEVSTISAVNDGQRILVAWTERGAGDVDRIVARVVDERGDPLDGGAPHVLAMSAGVQARPAVTALRSRSGFAVAWEAEGDAAHEDQSGRGIRMIVIDETGQPLFASWACGATDFQLNHDLEGDQTTPSLTTLQDGTVMAVWTGVDISETGIRSRALRPYDLLPLREESP